MKKKSPLPNRGRGLFYFKGDLNHQGTKGTKKDKH